MGATLEISRLNVFAHVIDHDDAHGAQFLLSEDPFQVWSVDHSMSLTSVKNPMIAFEEDWSSILIPEIPTHLAQRLLAIEREDVERLARVESYRRLGSARLVPIDPDKGPPGADAWGATRAERDLIWGQIVHIKRLIQEGHLGLFDSP